MPNPLSNIAGRNFLLPLFLAVIVNGLLLWHFHDRTWWPPDDGFSAHIAERFAQGEALSREVDQFVSGYLHFVNAAALELFGKDLVSLRYPLIALGLIQSTLVFLLFIRKGTALAVLASVVPTALGVLQYFNPNQHWYCLFWTIVLAWFLTTRTENGPRRFWVTGFLVFVIYMFRQVTGILTAVGALSFLLYDAWEEEGETARSSQPALFCRILIGLMLGGMIFYIGRMGDRLGILFLGIWPLIVLGWMALRVRLPNGRVWEIVKYFLLGGSAALLPEILYQLLFGNLGSWLDDTFLRMVHYAQADFFKKQMLFIHIKAAVSALDPFAGGIAWVNGLFWLGIFGAYLWVGAETVKNLFARGRSRAGGRSIPPLPFLSVFYAVVSLQYLIPHYIHETLPLVALAWGWGRGERSPQGKWAVVAVYAFFCFWGAAVYAGRPVPRSIDEILRTPPKKLTYAGGRLPFTSLWIEEEDIEVYSQMLQLIQRETRPEDVIFAVPYEAQFYFLSGRRNPFPFTIFSHGVQNEGELQAVIRSVNEHPPALIINAPSDKRQDRFSEEFIETIQGRYALLADVGMFEIYRPVDRIGK